MTFSNYKLFSCSSHVALCSLVCASVIRYSVNTRRTELSKSFFNQSVLDKNSCLHYLLPLPHTGFVDKLRSRLQYIPQTAKTARFHHSFLIYALNNYQT